MNKDKKIKSEQKDQVEKVKTITKRYDTFIKETNPLLDYYSKKTTFYKVNASVKIEEISTKIAEILNV